MSCSRLVQLLSVRLGDIPWEQRERRINNAQIVVVEMQQRVQQAKGYKEALNIIEEYVTIKSKGGLPMK